MAEDEAVVEMTKEDEEEKVSAAIASVTANRPGVTISIAAPGHFGTAVKPAATSSVTLTKATTESQPDEDDGEDEDDDENGSPGMIRSPMTYRTVFCKFYTTIILPLFSVIC